MSAQYTSSRIAPKVTDPDRLDSWKAIATYLGRDVATVRRWEKSAALPVRRIAGGRGRSVFAFKPEVDAWLAAADLPGGKDVAADPPALPAAVTSRTRRSVMTWALAALTLAGVVWSVRTSETSGVAGLRVRLTPEAVTGVGADGHARWRHSFPASEQVVLPGGAASGAAQVLEGHDPGVLAATSYRVRVDDSAVLTGQLLWFSPGGRLDHTLALRERIEFSSGVYEGPWAITDVRALDLPGTRRVAVTAHHFQWSPSFVTLLDGGWHELGTFVHAGWIEHVRWLSASRLIVSGFANERDGGMVALLDAASIDGQGPVADDSPLRCVSCGASSPIRYAVMPRSEVNRASESPFNRAVLERGGDRLIVRTIEVPMAGDAPAADAVYEFTPALELISASLSPRYWEVHRRLEAEGKLDHSHTDCPDRNGPRTIEIWQPGTGWAIAPVTARRH
jgi:hypothetical protein